MTFPETLEEAMVMFNAAGGDVLVKDLQVFLGTPSEAVVPQPAEERAPTAHPSPSSGHQ